jgi:hypothetical protein
MKSSKNTSAPSAATATTNASSEFNVAEWYNTPGSIYVKYVPSNINKEDLTYIFCLVGKVTRVDIVNSAPNKETGSCYRMAFIHFEFWHPTPASFELRNNITNNFPRPVTFMSHHCGHHFDKLTVMINTRPVAKTIYNVDQLSDMYQRLREEYTTTVGQLREELDEMKKLMINVMKKNTDDSNTKISPPPLPPVDETKTEFVEEEQEEAKMVDIDELHMSFERMRIARDPMITANLIETEREVKK